MDRSKAVAGVYPGASAEDEWRGRGTAAAALTDWLALYAPSWGSSVVLHAAVLVLAMFIAWQGRAAEEPFRYHTAIVREFKPKVQDPTRPPANPTKADLPRPLDPRPPGLIFPATTPVPLDDTPARALHDLAVISVHWDDAFRTFPQSDLDGKGGPDFCGLPFPEGGGGGGGGGGDGASKVVYVVDRSGSMGDSIAYVKYELKRSIRNLGPDKQFHVIFYSSGPALEMPARRLVTATDENKRKAFEFIDDIYPAAETDPTDAIRRAFAVGPDVIYLLTDGEFDRAVVNQVSRANPGGRVSVNTIAFLYRQGEKILKEIAGRNRGNYRFVSEADLATLEP